MPGAFGKAGSSTIWHVDEVFISIRGQRRYLWRAVGQDGGILDVLVTCLRDAGAANRFFRKLLKCQGSPSRLITDRVGSYGATSSRGWPMRYPPNRAVRQLQGRGVPPAREGEGAPNETIQIRGASSALSLGSQSDSESVPRDTPLFQSDPLLPASRTRLHRVEGRDVCALGVEPSDNVKSRLVIDTGN